jgi:hypothetical protein
VTDANIPTEVKRFLAEYIDSLFQLEVLLLLHAHREIEWSAERVDRELHIGSELVKKLLAALHATDLLSVNEHPDLTYRYKPATEELDRSVNLLATTYKERRVKVTSFIYSRPLDKIRSFAEAFRVRK